MMHGKYTQNVMSKIYWDVVPHIPGELIITTAGGTLMHFSVTIVNIYTA